MFIAPSKKDDLESLMYTMYYILRRDLPWGIDSKYSHSKIRELKLTKLKISDMTKNLPSISCPQ